MSVYTLVVVCENPVVRSVTCLSAHSGEKLHMSVCTLVQEMELEINNTESEVLS